MQGRFTLPSLKSARSLLGDIDPFVGLEAEFPVGVLGNEAENSV